MIQALSEYIKTIALFLILQAFITMIIPGDKFKAYIQIVLGFVLVAVIMKPAIQFFRLGEKDFEDIIPYHELSVSKGVMASESKVYEEKQQEYIIKNYKTMLEENIASYLLKKETGLDDLIVTVHVNADLDDLLYGELESVLVTAFIREEQSVQVEPVVITGKEPDVEKSSDEKEMEEKLKKFIQDFYNLSENNIHITVQTKT